MNAYSLPDYAESLSEFGTPLWLPHSRGTILKRPIPGFNAFDAMGGYPIFACEDWSGLRNDLSEIDQDLVSLGLVTDPHGNHDETLLKDCFDHVVQFKSHYIVDLDTPLDRIGSANRRKKARRALRAMDVEVCEPPMDFLDEWCSLYKVLMSRHGITGIRAFSREAFQKLFALPGVDILKATYDGEVVGALVILKSGDVAYGHLSATSEKGYALSASYALDLFSIKYYTGQVRLIDLGGGLDGGGLDDYKQGWATGTLPVYFCGRIFNPSLYEEITKASGVGHTSYFPAYRDGEYMTAKKVGMDHGH